jgi:hypothetical protein
MRRVVFLTLLALALPIAAWADGIDLTNQYGSISITAAGISSTQSQLTSFNGIVPPAHRNLGSVAFTTGALATGSIRWGGTFSATGSSFVVVGKGNYGQPKGTIFSGSFVGPITWTLTSAPNAKTLTYVLSGTIQGMLYDGRIVSGTTSQTFYTVNGQLIGEGIAHIRSGSTNLTVPEPGTLGLLGTGLVGIAGMFRRKLIGA